MLTLLITADALRSDHLTQYGYRRDTMPVLSELAAEGTRYDAAFANASHTALSIPSFLTSQLNGIEALQRGPTIGSALQAEGIPTGYIHSNLVLSKYFDRIDGFDQEYDLFEDVDSAGDDDESGGLPAPVQQSMERVLAFGEETVWPYLRDTPLQGHLESAYYSLVPSSMYHEPTLYADAGTVTDTAIEWLETHGTAEGFLWVHYMEPHRPYGYYLSDPEYTDREYTQREIIDLMAKASRAPESISDAELDAIVDLYDSDIRYMSEQITRLLDAVRTAGRWDETNVVFSADHGEEFREHGLFYHRNWPYEEQIHVPLVVKEARDTDSDTEDGLRQLLDIGPTVLEFHDVEPPAAFEGAPVTESAPDHVISTSLRDEFATSVRTDQWKYITTNQGDEVLYDLDADPEELTSVLETNAAIAADLDAQIPDSVMEIPENYSQREKNFSTSVEQRLEDLGYM